MATLDLETDGSHSSHFRYRELTENIPPDVIMVPIGGHDDTREPDDLQMTSAVDEAERAIENGVHPELISAGSSGSYFVKGSNDRIIGVFKPKDEEPYGQRNPKWAKRVQRFVCSCCFGRSCVSINQGYLSEVGASLVDQRLQLNIVPKTQVVKFASPVFNYSALDRATSRTKKTIRTRIPRLGRHFSRVELPLKVGSFQLFVDGYQDAQYWIRKFETDPPSDAVVRRFQNQLERLVVLDYIIRNTDRTKENWLIKYQREDEPRETESLNRGRQSCRDSPANVSIAAIDNGLAFPFKHPDAWRTYPFHWAWLSQANEPFSKETVDAILPLISDMNFVQDLTESLEKLFLDDEDFDPETFENQMSVMRGQILNLAQALRDRKSPFQLAQMPPVVVQRHRKSSPVAALFRRSRLDIGEETLTQKFLTRAPIFSRF